MLSPNFSSRVLIGVSDVSSVRAHRLLCFKLNQFLIGTEKLQIFSRKCGSFQYGVCISSFAILRYPLIGCYIRNTRYGEIHFK